jgi:hypothetical protein
VLAFLLLLIFVVDRLVNSATAGNSGGEQIAQGGGTLLGDQRIAVQIKALGKIERLEKLKVVQLTTKTRFANAPAVGDITLMWCWEPNIVIRFEEVYQALANQIGKAFESGGLAVRQELLNKLKSNLDFSVAGLELKFDQVVDGLLASKNYQPLGTGVVLIEGKQAYQILNNSVAVPIKPAFVTPLRNLCFALSISNLIPVQKHNFKIDTADAHMVRGKMCDQFIVHDPDGLKLQFYFDQETKLLAKIAHMGHDPRALIKTGQQVLWEHHFSDYREADGIKQWRFEEAFLDGQPFATLEVTDVRFFDEMQPELKRPNS